MALGRPAPMGMQEARNRTSRTALCFCATWGPRSLFQALRLVPFHSRRSRQRSGGLTSTTSFLLCPNLSSTRGGDAPLVVRVRPLSPSAPLLERRARGRDYACIRGLPRDKGIAEAEHGYACAESNAEGPASSARLDTGIRLSAPLGRPSFPRTCR